MRSRRPSAACRSTSMQTGLDKILARERAKMEELRSVRASKRECARMVPKAKNGLLVTRWIPFFFEIFPTSMFKDSTLRNKASRALLFLQFVLREGIARDEVILNYGEFEMGIESMRPLRLLFLLRDWLLLLAAVGHCEQTARNYAETIYAMISHLSPLTSNHMHVWKHVWCNTLRQCRMKDPGQAPPVSRLVFAKLSDQSQLLCILLTLTSWRFHTLSGSIQIVDKSKSVVSDCGYWTAMVSECKHIPKQTGLCKKIWCNCSDYFKDRFCFVHLYKRYLRTGRIEAGKSIISRSIIKRFRTEMKTFSIRGHSFHVASALGCYIFAKNQKIGAKSINKWNNWPGSASSIYKRYIRNAENFNKLALIPIDVALNAFLIEEQFGNS